ncbi:thioredoxin [Ruminococcus sp. HUN007]|jgi:thioredoxin 1|uniref:thioredoxin n=1 Tax=Ruminococcus sp. HUN007 TaxID=1514668 RepID=UPI0005D2832E|nr:thioredoxin [Ruminococcus sp. HUN007]
MAEINVTLENFEEEVEKCSIPVLLDFWAEWCGPCRMLSPVVAEVAKKYEGKIRVGKVNVDEVPELADSFGVSSIPMLMVMKEGKCMTTAVGYRDQPQVEKMLEEYI